MSERLTGYILLALGVVVIILALINGYGLFTGTVTPFKFINLQSIGVDLGKVSPLGVGGRQDLISGSDLSTTTNFFIHLVLLGFFVNVGAKLATLGVQLLRPIKIEVKDGKIISQ